MVAHVTVTLGLLLLTGHLTDNGNWTTVTPLVATIGAPTLPMVWILFWNPRLTVKDNMINRVVVGIMLDVSVRAMVHPLLILQTPK